MDQVQAANPTYRALHFLVRYGDWIVLVAALVPILLGGWAWSTGMSIAYGVAGLAAGAFVYLIMRSYVELVRVIVDMLLPK